jgi:hypothetical protein
VTTKKPTRRQRHAYNRRLVDLICERIAVDGVALREICQDTCMPARSTLFIWLGPPRFETRISCALRMGDACLIEVSLELPPSADVQGNAMRPAGQHLGVTQFQGDYIEPVLFQEPDESRLVSINYDQIRADAECIHVDPVAPHAFG